MTLSTLSGTSKSSTGLNSGKLAALLGIVVFLVDLLTKFLTAHFLPLSYLHSQSYPYGGIGVFKDFLGIEFSITHATNRGAAWGILAEYQAYLLLLRIVLVGGLLLYIILFNKDRSRLFPLVLIVAAPLAIFSIFSFTDMLSTCSTSYFGDMTIRSSMWPIPRFL